VDPTCLCCCNIVVVQVTLTHACVGSNGYGQVWFCDDVLVRTIDTCIDVWCFYPCLLQSSQACVRSSTRPVQWASQTCLRQYALFAITLSSAITYSSVRFLQVSIHLLITVLSTFIHSFILFAQQRLKQ